MPFFFLLELRKQNRQDTPIAINTEKIRSILESSTSLRRGRVTTCRLRGKYCFSRSLLFVSAHFFGDSCMPVFVRQLRVTPRGQRAEMFPRRAPLSLSRERARTRYRGIARWCGGPVRTRPTSGRFLRAARPCEQRNTRPPCMFACVCAKCRAP